MNANILGGKQRAVFKNRPSEFFRNSDGSYFRRIDYEHAVYPYIPLHTSSSRNLPRYPVYFRIFGIPEYQSIPFLERYLAGYAEDGFLEDESYLRQALIYWNVP